MDHEGKTVPIEAEKYDEFQAKVEVVCCLSDSDSLEDSINNILCSLREYDYPVPLNSTR